MGGQQRDSENDRLHKAGKSTSYFASLPHGHRGAGAEWPHSEFQPVELKKHSNQRKQVGAYQELLSRTATFSCVWQL